jgi:hypothetical protein
LPSIRLIKFCLSNHSCLWIARYCPNDWAKGEVTRALFAVALRLFLLSRGSPFTWIFSFSGTPFTLPSFGRLDDYSFYCCPCIAHVIKVLCSTTCHGEVVWLWPCNHMHVSAGSFSVWQLHAVSPLNLNFSSDSLHHYKTILGSISLASQSFFRDVPRLPVGLACTITVPNKAVEG